MHPEKKCSLIGIATAGMALIALSYVGQLTESTYGRSVQYKHESILVPFGDHRFSERMQGTVPFSDLDCGPYPDETNDPYVSEQKSLMSDMSLTEETDSPECADQYVGYDYIARRLEELIPDEERRPVTLVIMDSGINAGHEDWCEGQIDTELSKTFLDSVQIETSPLTDEVGHGSAVAGIAAACTGNGVGIASLGRGVDIASVKLMFPYAGGGMVNPSDWTRAMQYLGEQARADIDRQFVLNMSFAGFLHNQRIEDIINNFPDNVTLFAGAGNNPYNMPTDRLDYPAGYERVYAVGASVDESPDTLCGFSHYSTTKDRFMAAPGCFDLWGFRHENDGSFPYRDGLSGTSFSDPNLSGMFAYFLHIFPTLTPADIMQTIFDTSQTVSQASQGIIDKPIPAVSPLHAIQALALKAGYEEYILPPPEAHTFFLPVIER